MYDNLTNTSMLLIIVISTDALLWHFYNVYITEHAKELIAYVGLYMYIHHIVHSSYSSSQNSYESQIVYNTRLNDINH